MDSNLFAPERLRAIRDLITELEALPYVVRTESLFSLPNLHTDDDGYVHTGAYLETIPDTPEKAAEFRAVALKNTFVHRHHSEMAAIDATLRAEAMPITATSVSLALGFTPLEGQGQLVFPTHNANVSESRRLRRGDVFGVLAVVSEHTRFAPVVATTDVKVLALDWLQIRAIARSYPYSTSLLFCNLTRLVGERYSLHIAQDQGIEQVASARRYRWGSLKRDLARQK
jgi:hypothetical protein